MIKFIKGNIFSSSCQTIVNTVNCFGVMGAGIALEFRMRYPKMFNEYKKHCDEKLLKVGSLWLYKHNKDNWVLNFPTKEHWKYPSKVEYIESGLKKFINTYQQKGITSIAFPILGSDKGGIAPNQSIDIMKKYLSNCEILIEIYEFDPSIIDERFKSFKSYCLDMSSLELLENCGIKERYSKVLLKSLKNPLINNLTTLSKEKGISIKTIVTVYKYFDDNQIN